MDSSNGVSSNDPTALQDPEAPVSSKGKGKAVDATPGQDAMMEDDDSSDEESGVEEPAPEEEEDDEDNMEEIDLDNIITDGRRTRGKTIDFAKAAEQAKEDGEDLDDDDEDDDEDFEAQEEDVMQE